MRKGESASKVRLTLACVVGGLLMTACADLKVTSLHHQQWLTTTLSAKAAVTNEGTRSAPASVTKIEFRAAGSSTWTRNASVQTPALAPGQQVELFPTVSIFPNELPAVGSGQCMELKGCADSTGTTSEGLTGEGNNCRTTSYCR